MNSSIYRINLDIHDARPQASIRLTQNDTARRIVIFLSDGGLPYIIADDCYAAFTSLKPCFVYTSDAADEADSWDLGCRSPRTRK